MAFGDKTKKFQDEKAAKSDMVTLSKADLKDLIADEVASRVAAAEVAVKAQNPDMPLDMIERIGQVFARESRKAANPSNPDHRHLSAFSYPEGDVERPRPELPFSLLWKGFPVHKETSVVPWWELEQFVTLKPGTYTCIRRDGAPIKVTARAEYDVDGTTMTGLIVEFDVTRDTRSHIPSPYVFAYQMNHADRDPRETFAEAMASLVQIEWRDRKAKESLAVA